MQHPDRIDDWRRRAALDALHLRTADLDRLATLVLTLGYIRRATAHTDYYQQAIEALNALMPSLGREIARACDNADTYHLTIHGNPPCQPDTSAPHSAGPSPSSSAC